MATDGAAVRVRTGCCLLILPVDCSMHTGLISKNDDDVFFQT